MSIYNFILTYGFSVSKKEIEKKFSRRTKGKFHLERRFDPRTGQEVAPEKVWDTPEKEFFLLDGKELKFEDYRKYNKFIGSHPTFRTPEFGFGKEYELVARNDFQLLCWLLANQIEEERNNFIYGVSFYSLRNDEICFYLPLNKEDNCSDWEDEVRCEGLEKVTLKELNEKQESILKLKSNLGACDLKIDEPQIFVRLEYE